MYKKRRRKRSIDRCPPHHHHQNHPLFLSFGHIRAMSTPLGAVTGGVRGVCLAAAGGRTSDDKELIDFENAKRITEQPRKIGAQDRTICQQNEGFLLNMKGTGSGSRSSLFHFSNLLLDSYVQNTENTLKHPHTHLHE